MARQTGESKLTKQILHWLDELIEQGKPVYYEHRSGSGGFGYHRGVPDLFIIINSLHIEIELKIKDGVRSADQEKFEWKCKQRGVPYLCPRSLEEFQDYVKKILD